MKVLLFFSGQSSLSHIFSDIFKRDGIEVEVVNYLTFVPPLMNRLVEKAGKLPRRFEGKIRKEYLKIIQESYLKIITEKKPDLIFIYNDQMLLAETLDKIDKKIKIGMYLADSPLFLQKRAHIIGLLLKADFVFAPDTYWIEQCRVMGVKNIEYLIPGYNSKHHFQVELSKDDQKKYGIDVFFMGSPYPDNWGYKRALFLSKFCGFDFRLLGPGSWRNWFGQFPELESKWTLNSGYVADDELNLMMNAAKIYPVDANPGIINGIHIRVLDCIAAGVMPLIEYRKDLDNIFKGIDITFIKDYNEIPALTTFYLKTGEKRSQLVKEMRASVLKKFTAPAAFETISAAMKL